MDCCICCRSFSLHVGTEISKTKLIIFQFLCNSMDGSFIVFCITWALVLPCSAGYKTLYLLPFSVKERRRMARGKGRVETHKAWDNNEEDLRDWGNLGCGLKKEGNDRQEQNCWGGQKSGGDRSHPARLWLITRQRLLGHCPPSGPQCYIKRPFRARGPFSHANPWDKKKSRWMPGQV